MKIWSHKLAQPLLILIGILSLFGQFGRTQTSVGFVSWYEIVMLLFVVGSLPLLKSVRLKKNVVIISLFFPWTLMVTLLQSEVAVIGLAYLARLFLYFLFGFSLNLFLKANALSQKFLRVAVTLWLSLFASLGIFQFLLLPDTRMFFYLGWDDHLSRAFATLFDPGYFGLLMVAGVLFTLWDAKVQKQWWHQILLAMFLIATALSYSRASYLGLCIGVVVLSLLARSKRMLLVLPLFIMSLVLLPKDGGGAGQNLVRTQTLAMREEVAQIHTRSLGWKEYLLGRGWYYEKSLALHATELGENQKGIERQNSGGVDNAFLHVFLSTGIIGSVLFFIMLWSLIKESKSIFWKAFFAAASAHSFFSLGLLYPWVLLVLAVTFFLREEPSSYKKTA